MILRLGIVLLLCFLPFYSQQAHSQELNLGKQKLFLTFNAKTKYTQTHIMHSGRKVTKRSKQTDKFGLLLRQVKGDLFVVFPDFGEGMVFVDGKSVKSSGIKAGKGKSLCVDLGYEDGYTTRSCASYKYKNNVIEIRQKTQHISEKGIGNLIYKVKYNGTSCSFISYSGTTKLNQYYDPMIYSDYPDTKRTVSVKKEVARRGKCSIR